MVELIISRQKICNKSSIYYAKNLPKHKGDSYQEKKNNSFKSINKSKGW